MVLPSSLLPPASRLLLWRTVRHLRPVQVLARLRACRRWRRWERNPRPAVRRYHDAAGRLLPFDAAGVRRVIEAGGGLCAGVWATDDAAHHQAAMLGAGRFEFLNRQRALGVPPRWQDPELNEGTRLWKSCLHHFEYAPALVRAGRADLFVTLARDWAEHNPFGLPDTFKDTWAARAAGIRMISWMAALALAGATIDAPDRGFLEWQIAFHAAYVADNQEDHLLGNHLFTTAFQWAFAAHALRGALAERWRPRALALLRRQVDDQVLDDGGHDERSFLYHTVLAGHLADLARLLGSQTPPWLAQAHDRMIRFLDRHTPPDGRIPLFNDAAWDEAPPRRCLGHPSGSTLGPTGAGRAARRRTSGYCTLSTPGEFLTVVAGPAGPPHQMGHAHSDLLSLEFSLRGRRLIVDTGTYTYARGPMRQYCRSTAAHNTLRIDAAEQLETWDSFRVGRRGQAWLIGAGRMADWQWVAAGHNAYRFLPGRPIHTRLVALHRGRRLVVLDRLTGRGRRGAAHPIEGFWHFAPQVTVDPAEPGGWQLDGPSGPVRVAAWGFEGSQWAAAAYCPRFNVAEPIMRLRLEARAALPWSGGIVFDFSGDPPIPSGQAIDALEYLAQRLDGAWLEAFATSGSLPKGFIDHAGSGISPLA